MGLKDIRQLRALPEQRQINYKRLAIICVPLIIVTALLVFFFQYMADSQTKRPVVRVEKNTISLLYSSKDGKLSETIVEIDNTGTLKDKGIAIVGELKKAGLVSEDVALQDLVIDSEGVIYLNFTRDLLQGTANRVDDIATVYALVNSFLASFRYTKKVQLLVDWKPVYTLRGTVYTYLPMEFNKQVMED
jgi:tRNA A-37 threonylcarbamoyl transferase component Bud32